MARLRSLARSGLALVALAVVACAPRPATLGRPLRIALHSPPFSLDPHRRNEALTANILHHIFDGLTAFDARLNLVPALAESWENPNDLTWRFHLRQGVRFQDGRPFSSADVVFSLERVRKPRVGTDFEAYIVAVDRVRAVDPFTVEITTRRPYPILLNKLAYLPIVPQGSPDEIRAPIGTGPYRLVRQESDRLVLEAFPDSWHPAPAEAEVELLAIPEAAGRLRAIAAGDVDLALEPAFPEPAAPDATAGYHLLSADSLSVVFLMMRPDRPPFDDRRVRQAIDLALDREGLVRRGLHGLGSPLGQMVGRNVFGYVPDLPPPEQDVARARRLLAAAGYPQGFDADLEFRSGRDGQAVARQLAEVGIRVRPIERPWSEMYPRLVAGDVGFYLGALLYISADASDFFDIVAHTAEPARGYGSNNRNGYSDRELDALIESSGTTLDMMSRRAALARCMRKVMEDLVFVPLYTPHNLFALRNDVEWTPRVDGQVLAYEVRRLSR